MNSKIKFSGIVSIVLLSISFLLTFSCNNGNTVEETEPTAEVSKNCITEISFDSSTELLTVSTSLKDGSILTADISSSKIQAVSTNGKAVFDLGFYFDDVITGGTQLSIKVTAPNGDNLSKKITYEPKAIIEFVDGSIINVFNSQATSLELPDIKVNYPVTDYKTIWSYKAVTTDSLGSIETVLNNFDAVKAFLGNEANIGSNVVLICEVIPLKKEKLKVSAECTLYCYKDTQAKDVSVDYDYYDDCFMAKLWTDNTHIQAAGGNVSFSWETSSDGTNWTALENKTSDKYYYGDELLNKYLRIKAVQTIDNVEKDPLYKEYGKVLGKINPSTLEYNGFVLEGYSPSISKVNAESFSEKFTSAVIEDCTLKFIKSYNYLYVSRKVEVLVSKENYLPCLSKVYVPVKSSFSSYEYPTLLTDTTNITAGMVQFAQINEELEYSFKDTDLWTPVTKTPFKANTGDILCIRKTAVGVKNYNGYIMESDVYELTVTEQNIGTLINGSGINLDFTNFDVKIKKSYAAEPKIWTFEIEYSDLLKSYIEKGTITVEAKFSADIDDTDTYYTSTITYSEDKQTMYINIVNWPAESYRVNLFVTATQILTGRSWLLSDSTTFVVE